MANGLLCAIATMIFAVESRQAEAMGLRPRNTLQSLTEYFIHILRSGNTQILKLIV
jgi:hypothetical protein